MLKNRGGFTLFEVMITMAVSGALLVSAIIMFGGQQTKVQFSQGVKNLEETLQDIMNDTSTGYFPRSTYSCSPGPDGPVISTSVVSEQGANQGCVFLGKALHLKSTGMDVYPLIGNRLDTSSPTATFKTSLPLPVVELMDSKTYLWGIELYEIWWNDTSTSHFADGRLIVFGTTPNGTGSAGAGGYFNSGVQKVNTYTSSGPTAAVGDASSVNAIKSALRTDLSWPSGGTVTLCFRDSSSRQHAGVIVGGGSAGLSVRGQVEADVARCS